MKARFTLRRREAVFAVFGAVAMLLCVNNIYGRFYSAQKTIAFFRRGNTLLFDFVDTYWPMGRAMLTGSTPVDGYYYSPAFALFLRLFAAESVDVASARWFGLLVAFALFSATLGFVVLRERARSPGPWIFVALNWSSYYFYGNLFWGQVTELAFVFVLLSAYLNYRGRTFASAAVLATICSVKYFFGLFVLQFVNRKNWRALVPFAVLWVALLFALPTSILGLGPTLEFFRLVRTNMAHDLALYALDPSDQFPLYVARRWFPDANRAATTAAAGVWLFTFAAAGFTFWSARGLRETDRYAFMIRTTAALLLVLPCLTPTAWEHYFYALPFVQAALIGELFRDGIQRSPGRVSLVSTLIGVTILLSNVLPMIWLRKFTAVLDPWWDVPLDQAKYGLPLVANLTLLLALAVLERPGSRPEPSPA